MLKNYLTFNRFKITKTWFFLVTENVLEQNELPWQIMKQVGRESIYRMHVMRFYLQLKQDPHGTSVALFVGNLPKNISERNYETFLKEILGKGEFTCFYNYGSLLMYIFSRLLMTAFWLNFTIYWIVRSIYFFFQFLICITRNKITHFANIV